MGKLFVVSDIHGNCSILKEALKNAGFDSRNKDHILVCLGDLFDRGDENLETLHFFEQISNKVTVRGNHEDILLDVLSRGFLTDIDNANGTKETIKEFFGQYSLFEDGDMIDFSGKTRLLDRITDFISEMVDYFETRHYIFVHGWLPVKFYGDNNPVLLKNWRKATEKEWREARWVGWQEAYQRGLLVPDKTVVCGHRSCSMGYLFDSNRYSDDYSIFYGEGLIAIDAFTHKSKKINVLVIEDEESTSDITE